MARHKPSLIQGGTKSNTSCPEAFPITSCRVHFVELPIALGVVIRCDERMTGVVGKSGRGWWAEPWPFGNNGTNWSFIGIAFLFCY